MADAGSRTKQRPFWCDGFWNGTENNMWRLRKTKVAIFCSAETQIRYLVYVYGRTTAADSALRILNALKKLGSSNQIK